MTRFYKLGHYCVDVVTHEFFRPFSRQQFQDNFQEKLKTQKKDPEACQKRADFLSTFRSDFVEARAEYDRCCAKYKTPGCCLKSAHFMYYDELKKE